MLNEQKEREDEQLREREMAQEKVSSKENVVAQTELDIKNKLKAAAIAANEAEELAKEAEDEAHMIGHKQTHKLL